MSSLDFVHLEKWIKEDLFNAVPIAIAVIDRDFNIVHANSAFSDTFGEWKNRKCFSVYKKKETQCAFCIGAQAYKDGNPRVSEELGHNKEGNLTHYIQHITPIKDKDGNVLFLVEMSIDITDIEQVRTEYQLLFDQVPCNIMIIDRNFRIVKKNNQLLRSMGEIEGEYCFKSLKGFDKKCDYCTASQTFKDGQMHSGYHTWTSPDGQKMHQQVITVPLPLADGSFDTVMEMAVDITEIKRLEDEKLEAERLAVVGQTVAGLAHGIKNLITGLDGGLYLLSSGISKHKTERMHKGLDMLQRNIGRISSFVKVFLDFSKGRTINVDLNDPAEIAEEVVELYGPKAKEQGIELKSEVLGKVEPAYIDYESMHECLTNFVGNAIDACLMSDEQQGRRVLVRTFEKNGVIIYEVIDNGCGMDYEVKQKVFTAFFTTKGMGGSGIGLLVSKKIVQEHGGRIEMTSEPGQGSTFRILLPRDRLPKKKIHDDLEDETS